MNTIILKVKKFGNSWGIHLPPYLVKMFNLKNKTFEVNLEKGQIKFPFDAVITSRILFGVAHKPRRLLSSTKRASKKKVCGRQVKCDD